MLAAAIITITPSGQVIHQVLGDSTIEVKSVAENIAVNNGKVELTNANMTTSKEDLVEIMARASTNDLKIGTQDNKFTIEEMDRLKTQDIRADEINYY